MDEKEKNVQEENKSGGLKGFFKKIKDTLAKADKVMDDAISKEDFSEEEKKDE